ncbi:MAG: SAM-dependent chlorinase/fluorinase, partial [Thermoproteota archaeon]|nr:SAM-dependent chlorinase/fluorinase [Thermoproteota archaeon]
MSPPIITLLSDFGLKDPYVAEMKAVILSICPEAHIVDISHEIEKFNVRMGAFVLASASPYFPKDAVHMAVVDPGVGTKRRSIIVETTRDCFVGPDNGLLTLAAYRHGIHHIYTITNPKYMLPQVSKTFHGRDIFAPAAAYLAKGCAPSEFGPEIRDYIFPKFAKPYEKENKLQGEVLHVDGFGNIITNISRKDLENKKIHEGEKLQVNLKRRSLTLKFCSAYGEEKPKKPLAVIGSSGFMEISVNQGNAAEFFKIRVGDNVSI